MAFTEISMHFNACISLQVLYLERKKIPYLLELLGICHSSTSCNLKKKQQQKYTGILWPA